MLRLGIIFVFLVVSLIAIEVVASTPTFKPSNKTEPAYYDYDEFEINDYPSDYYYYDISLNKVVENEDDAKLSDDDLMYKLDDVDSDLDDREQVHEIKNAQTIILDVNSFPVIKAAAGMESTTKVKNSQHDQNDKLLMQLTTMSKEEKKRLVVEKTVISEDTFLNMSYVLIGSIGIMAILLAMILVVLRQKRVNRTQHVQKTKIVAQKEYISVEQVNFDILNLLIY